MPIITPPQENNQEELELRVENELRRLHISGTLDGFHYLAAAVAMTVRDPEAIRWVTKGLYIEVAQRHHTTPARVERSIRTAIRVCWERGGWKTLDQMAGYHLTQRPTASELIDLVAAYIRNKT